MSSSLALALIIFGIAWFIVLIVAVRHNRISVRYSMIWFFAALIVFLVGAFPGFIEWINSIFHFAVISNLIIGILIALLMVITFALTLFVTKQKKQIDSLIQEISILKGEYHQDDRSRK